MANSNQEIATPWPFFRAVESFLGITFQYDMAAVHENNKCGSYWTKEDDSFSMEWPTEGWCWLNPPFRNVGEWVEKCLQESRRGCRIVSIWPLSGDLNQIRAWTHAKVYVVHGRVWPEVRSCMLCVWDFSQKNREVSGLRWNKESLKVIW